MDLVERLRRKEHDPYCGQCIDGMLSEEAADEIERLREALRFYAKTDYFPTSDGPWGVDSDDFGNVARAALKGDE